GVLHSAVIYVDTFGNVKLAGTPADLATALGAPPRPGDELEVEVLDGPRRRVRAAWRHTFGEAVPGEVLMYEDSYGRVCIAANQGNAAAALGLEADMAVVVRRAGHDGGRAGSRAG